MKKRRYFVAECLGGALPLWLKVCSSYHYVWLDGQTIFGLGDFDVNSVQTLDDDDSCTLLSLQDTKPFGQGPQRSKLIDRAPKDAAKAEEKRQRHVVQLQAHGVADTDSTPTIVSKIYGKFGHPMLLPDS